MNAAQVIWQLCGPTASALLGFFGVALLLIITTTQADAAIKHMSSIRISRGQTIRSAIGRAARARRSYRAHWHRSPGGNLALYLSGLIAFTTLPGIVTLASVFTPFIIASYLTRHEGLRGVPWGWLVGLFLGPAVFIGSLRFALAPRELDRRGKRMYFSLSSIRVDREHRVAFANEARNYQLWRYAAGVGCSLGALGFYAGASERIEAQGKPEATAPATVESYLFWFFGLGLAWLMFRFLISVVESRFLKIRAATAIYDCLIVRGSIAVDSTPLRIPDPLGKQRMRLGRAIKILKTLAKKLDGTSPLHPLATLLYGCAQELADNSARTESLSENHPTRTFELLEDALVVMAGPRNGDEYTAIAQRTLAYSDAGIPQARLRLPLPNPYKEVAGKFTDFQGFVDKVIKLFLAFWSLFALAVTVYLVASGQTELSSLTLGK